MVPLLWMLLVSLRNSRGEVAGRLPSTAATSEYSNRQWFSTRHYGIWDRAADFDKSTRPFLKGWAASLRWSDFEPQEGKFDYTVLNDALSRAHDADGGFYAEVTVGPDSPDWIYKYTPKVQVQKDPKHKKFEAYPYYLDAAYINLRNKMINALGTYLRHHANADSVGFVQASFGCTGDAVLYKAEPKEKKYRIDDADAKKHMYGAWAAYKSAFQDGDGRVIPVLVNPMDDEDAEQLETALTTFNGAMGLKASAVVRGHHLSGERSWIESHRASMLNSSAFSSVPFFFSRAEMDQTWTYPLANINIHLFFYWGIINGLNQGLGVHDVSKNALSECYKQGFADSWEFFNTYAPQVWPMNSTNAFIALHEGLDANDLTKFPEDQFGPAGKNLERIRKICAAYEEFGCAVDDKNAALKGQVYQRKQQTGYNDVGYDIWPTNYGRWIEQIDADATSQGLFRVGGNIEAKTSKYARFARGLIHSKNKTGMYFKFSDGFFSTSPGQINMHMIWYDSAPGSFQVHYVDQSGNPQVAVNQECLGEKVWKENTFQIRHLGLRLGVLGSDFSITSSSSTDVVVHLLEAARSLDARAEVTHPFPALYV